MSRSASPYHRVKKKVHELLHPEIGHTVWDRFINLFIITLILLNVLAVMLETVHVIYDTHIVFFHYFDLVSVIFFSLEYLLRVWSCTIEAKYKHSIFGRIRYMLSPGGLIDLLAILPFYLHVIIGLDLRVLRILRLMRLLRVFRLTAYTRATKLVKNVFWSRRNELMLSLVLTLFLLIISSCLIYFVEHAAQPSNFTSIPDTFWWSIVTLTTVGYGDMIPITVLGKVLTGILLLTGVALFALPAGIITAGFLEEARKSKKSLHNCPHCGLPVEVGADDQH